MEWLSFGGVTWWAVGLAFVVTFVLGWLWYSPQGFFPVWARLGKLDLKAMGETNMVPTFLQTTVANALGVIVLAVLIVALDVDGWVAGLLTGAIIGLVFRAGAHAIHNGFAQRHPGITLIDAAHDTVALAIAGAILGAVG